ncbi:endoplasmic reticulum metallopeptidase 1-like isoform X2 [Planococcus citri]|uniref:endoplasmic reticulum metallopeptidase 1-like isoform X2 n=1 Tax=Planococcus citri TaxID=170843 RepID=UPI0031F9E4A0
MLSDDYKNDTVKLPNSKLRLRTKFLKQSEILPKHYDKDKIHSNTQYPIPLSHFVTHLCFMIVVYVIIVYMEKRLPTPLTLKDESTNPDRFIAERSRNYLLNLTKLGPRPVGSFENEVLAINFFVKEINNIINNANKAHRITYDLQKVSGSFPLTFLDGMTNIYKDVQNVIVKIGPIKESAHSLLVNCHFDTVVDSPGGSDDGASCAVMLEILRIISKMNTPLKHNIIFLFNGAEENYMQASHGFITQHKWAKSIRAFVNLEACGAGGREILFQAGPENPWLIQAYSDVAPYPLASSLAQEIFQSGLVPGDTDYRIFRDFGKISGLDFAWSSNGYVYHTKLDDVHQIPLGTLQRTGDNMLPLILRIANSEHISNIQEYQHGNLVFFDFLGTFIVSGKELIATVINALVAAASFYSIWYNMKHSQGVPRKVYTKGLTWGVCSILFSWIITLVSVMVIAFLITLLNRPLSWYARPQWIFFLYIIPTFIIPVFISWRFQRKFKYVFPSSMTLFQVYNDSNLLIFTTISVCLTLARIRSNFIVSIWLGFSFLTWVLRNKLSMFYTDHKQLWLQTFCMLIPFILSSYIINGVEIFIVPIMGRSGSGNHAELVLSFIMSVMLVLMFSFYVPITLLVNNLKTVVKALAGIFLAAVLVLLFTPLGFPYSGDLLAPAPQRYMISHVERTFYDIEGKVRKNDSGLWICNMDVNSPRMVSGLIPDMSKAKLIEKDCEEELYCGLPYIVPVMTIMWETHWIPAPRPILPSNIELALTYRDYRPDNIQRLSFQAKGPDHMTLFVSPYPGVVLKSWSLVGGPPLEGPKWKNRSTYYVYYSYGSDPQPWNFWLDLEVENAKKGEPIVDLGFSGYFIHGAHQTTPQLKKLFSQFPPWTVTTGWTSTLKSYTF